MPETVQRKYPTVRSKTDTRDFMLAPRGATIQVPSSYDLSRFLGPVKDQGPLGACTGFSWSSVREFLYRKYFLFEKNQTVAKNDMILSPLYLYYMERLLEGDVSQDDGAQSRTGGKVLTKYGCCLATLDPYKPSIYALAPTDADNTNALLYLAGSYHSVPDLGTLRATIYTGYVASIGITVYESFESDQAAASGNIPIPEAGEQILGGHEVTPFGYDDEHINEDDSNGAVHFLNSWGANWGAKVGPTRKEAGGSGWLPYSYFTPDLVSDIWTLRLPS